MRDLLPCPFCGREVKLHPTYDTDTDKANGYFVMCRNKNCMALPEAAEYPTEAEAIAAWNTRAERTCSMEYNEYWSDNEIYPTEAYQCSVCGHITQEGLPNYCPNCGAKVVS